MKSQKFASTVPFNMTEMVYLLSWLLEYIQIWLNFASLFHVLFIEKNNDRKILTNPTCIPTLSFLSMYPQYTIFLAIFINHEIQVTVKKFFVELWKCWFCLRRTLQNEFTLSYSLWRQDDIPSTIVDKPFEVSVTQKLGEKWLF